MRKFIYSKKILFINLIFTIILNFIFMQFVQAASVAAKQAFKLSAHARDEQTLILHWDIHPGYHLYRNKIKVKAQNPQRSQVAPALLPPGTPQHNKELGNYQTYQSSIDIGVPLLTFQGENITLIVHYQGCGDDGYCYPPVIAKVTIPMHKYPSATVNAIKITGIDGASANKKTLSPQSTAQSTTQSTKKSNKFSTLFSQSHWWWICLSFVGFGLLIAFTPCILPMLPILSGLILGRKQQPSTGRAFLLSLSYVIGMSVSYAVAGLILSSVGSNIQTWMQRPAILIPMSILMIIMALSSFGWFDINLPSSWQTRLHNISDHQKSGNLFGCFGMGAIAALVVSPCVTPPLIGALAFITQRGEPALGAGALFCMGFGMGIPLLIIGTLGGRWMPRQGPWMNGAKYLLGYFLLAVATWLLSRLLSPAQSVIAWGILAIIIGLISGALRLPRRLWRDRLRSVFAWCAVLLGIIWIADGSRGQQHLWPLTYKHTHAHAITFKLIKNNTDLQKILNSAPKNKIIILDFHANWCISCQIIENEVFTNNAVKQALAPMLKLRADVTKNDQHDQQLQRSLNVVAPPTILFFRNAKEIPRSRLAGEITAKQLINTVRELKDTK